MPFAPFRSLPPAIWTILREAARHLLRRPVVSVSAAARVPDGRWLLIRRGDFGSWALPGGTLEWGETLRDALAREIREESGAELVRVTRLVGVYSRPERDPRFHSVSVVAACEVTLPTRAPVNPLEILEVGLFEEAALPTEFAFNDRDALDAARLGADPIFD